MNSKVKLMEKVLKLSGNQIMNVKFIKKSDGTLRSLNGRFGTTKGTVGGKKTTSVEKNGVLTVREMGRGNVDKFRNITLENVQSVKIKGTVFNFVA